MFTSKTTSYFQNYRMLYLIIIITISLTACAPAADYAPAAAEEPVVETVSG